MKHTLFRQAMTAGAIALVLGASGIAGANDNTNGRTQDTASTATSSSGMTGKQKATAIGAGSGAAVGALVGGPVGAVVGAGVGAYVGHEGTDANGRVNGSATAARGDRDVRRAQAALNDHGYALAVDGIKGPNTERALRDFQARSGLAQTGALDEATRERLGLTS